MAYLNKYLLTLIWKIFIIKSTFSAIFCLLLLAKFHTPEPSYMFVGCVFEILESPVQLSLISTFEKCFPLMMDKHLEFENIKNQSSKFKQVELKCLNIELLDFFSMLIDCLSTQSLNI